MATIKLVADYNREPCTGCKLCDIVCPSGAIRMEARRPVIDDAACIGCGRCVDRCPEEIMWMKPREVPLVATVTAEEAPAEAVEALLLKAGIDPAISVCVCTLTSAAEIARSVVKGAQTLEEVCAMTGMRSGCGIYCVAPALRLLAAAGRDMTPPPQHRWYPATLSLYDLSDEVRARYPDAFIDEDRAVFDPQGRYGPLEGTTSKETV
ncbi:4Fe-4S binding protein [Novosphingobium olei]|uniref:4Fe-4S binding protein n=1 Tax=Novosphingobium olei TaxID=2728851 RepID=UPI00308A9D1F|nr:4Fe-4S binding protein [Novosphingobium olei]